jgi:hypothetical protein
MAHILVGLSTPPIRSMAAEVLADEGHEVTVSADFWGGLGVLRASLHPLIVLYQRDGSPDVLTDEHLAAIEANRAALRRHEYIQLTGQEGPWPVRVQRLVDQVHIQAIPGLLRMEELLEAVDRAAARLAEQAGA